MQPDIRQCLLPNGDFTIVFTGAIASCRCGKPLPGLVPFIEGAGLTLFSESANPPVYSADCANKEKTKEGEDRHFLYQEVL